MSEKRFKDASAQLAASQALVDKVRGPVAQPQAQMPPPPAPVQAPVPAPTPAPVETPTPAAPADTKSTQQTVEELSQTIGTGFEALNKVADTLKEITGKKPKISDRIKARLNKTK